jgi:hypothetical protein
MIDQKAVQLEMATGLGFVCALCTHYHEAKSQGRKDCGQKECGGPSVGKLFPMYQGELPREALARHCYRCGDPADGGALGRGDGRALGFCKAHEEWVSKQVDQYAKHVHLPMIEP